MNLGGGNVPLDDDVRYFGALEESLDAVLCGDLRRCLQVLPQGGVVNDVGCGTGCGVVIAVGVGVAVAVAVGVGVGIGVGVGVAVGVGVVNVDLAVHSHNSKRNESVCVDSDEGLGITGC